MRALVTGGGGFLGGRVVGVLCARGDRVVALARSDASAAALRARFAAAGAADRGEVVRGDVADPGLLRSAADGVDAVFHVAGIYEVGIPAERRPAMFSANVDGTRAVLEAAVAAGVRRIVYVSTLNVFGNTGGVVADESFERRDRRFLSYYDETKFVAHLIAVERAKAGAPLVIVQPGAIYGPGDHSETGRQFEQARRGGYRVRIFSDLGLSLGHVDDIAAGVLAAHDRGRTGESYVIAGENTSLGAALDAVARACGHKPPRVTIPSAAVRALSPLGPLLGPALGVGPDLAEVVRASDGVTYWGSSEKARRELGYSHRDFAAGIADLCPSPA